MVVAHDATPWHDTALGISTMQVRKVAEDRNGRKRAFIMSTDMAMAGGDTLVGRVRHKMSRMRWSCPAAGATSCCGSDADHAGAMLCRLAGRWRACVEVQGPAPSWMGFHTE